MNQIYYTITDCPLGKLLVAATDKGICLVSIENNKKALMDYMQEMLSGAVLVENANKLTKWTKPLEKYLAGSAPWPSLPYDAKGTEFQHKVWKSLYKIPSGKTLSYSELAKSIKQPKAARAVASACAKNPVALVVPCHRILPKSGGVGGFRWHPSRKEKLLRLEKN